MRMSNWRRRHRRSVETSRSPRPRPVPIEELEGRELLTLLGQQLFPSDNPWNQIIANAPVAANSNAIMSNIITVAGKDGNVHADFGQDTGAAAPLYGIPYNAAHGDAVPAVNVVIGAYASESDVAPAPVPANAVIEGDMPLINASRIDFPE
jgi:hypothetical protein